MVLAARQVSDAQSSRMKRSSSLINVDAEERTVGLAQVEAGPMRWRIQVVLVANRYTMAQPSSTVIVTAGASKPCHLIQPARAAFTRKAGTPTARQTRAQQASKAISRLSASSCIAGSWQACMDGCWTGPGAAQSAAQR